MIKVDVETTIHGEVDVETERYMVKWMWKQNNTWWSGCGNRTAHGEVDVETEQYMVIEHRTIHGEVKVETEQYMVINIETEQYMVKWT